VFEFVDPDAGSRENPWVSVRFHAGAFRERGDDPSSWNEHIVVESQQLDAVAVALDVCVDRMMLVGRSGREYTESELDKSSLEPHTPSFASRMDDDGFPGLYVDCQSSVGRHRSATFRRIVREELESAGVSDALVRPVGSLPGSVRDLEERVAPPEWVRFAEANPPGFPASLLPAEFVVVHREGGPICMSIGDRFYNGEWAASIELVSDEQPQDLLRVITAQLIDSGCVVRSPVGRLYVSTHGFQVGLEWDGHEVLLETVALKGARGKPAYLRRRSETSAARLMVIHPKPAELPL
jgi:hypothetical protein